VHVRQPHHLASLGCPVAGRRAQLFLFDRMFTHLERENSDDLTGKLGDDLLRIRAILDQATGRSIISMNEAFTSTTLNDALALGRKLMAHATALAWSACCVTFVDELSSSRRGAQGRHGRTHRRPQPSPA
jgi:DNA mismatch repair ATPase MutS